MKDTLSKVPVLRIILPFVAGILSAYYTYIPTVIAIIAILISIMAFIFLNKSKSPKFLLNYNFIYIIPIILICYSFGIINTNIHREHENVLNYGENCIANATITEITDIDFSTNMLINVNSIIDSCGNISHISDKMTAWIENNDYSLTEGDIISFNFRPQYITNRGNPEEFDYARYMANKGYIYHVFIKQNDYRKTGHNNNIISYSKKIQRDLKNFLLNSNLNPEVKTFFIAILLGEPSAIKNETKKQLSYAGIAHILALSGLHIGIIALLLNILLFPLDYFNFKKLRFVLTLIIIIIYAFISGLSVSVIRATIMIGFLVTAKIIHRKNSSLNALFAAATIILLTSPFAVFDIGFQFSFITVLFILLLSNKLSRFNPKQEILYYTYSVFLISAISMVGTVLLTAYYFNYISIFSILANILIIPILPIIVGIGIIYLLLLSLGFEPSVLTDFLNNGYKYIWDISYSITSSPYSLIDNIYISPIVLGLSYMAIFSLILFIYRHKAFYIYCTITIILGSIIYKQLETRSMPQSGYVIINDGSTTPILTFSHNHASLHILPDDSTTDSFKDKHKRFLSKYNINTININHIKPDNNGVFYSIICGEKIAVICNNHTKHISMSPRINIDKLIVTNKYFGGIDELLRSFDPKLIVLSGNIYYKKHDELVNECIRRGIKYHSLMNDGAISNYFN